jgi:hypothetical protein
VGGGGTLCCNITQFRLATLRLPCCKCRGLRGEGETGKEKSAWCNEKYLMQAEVSARGYKFATWEFCKRKEMYYDVYMREKPHKCVREREGDETTSCMFVLLKVALHLLQNLTVKTAVTLIKFMDLIACLFYIKLLRAPSIQNPILTSQHPILKKMNR